MLEWIDSQNQADKALHLLTGSDSRDSPIPEQIWDLVVLGGGSAGLVAAFGASGLGAKVLLIENHLLGGDCLHSGCVPSKAILEAAFHPPHLQERDPKQRFRLILESMRQTRAEMANHDSKSRLNQAGIHVAFGMGHFAGPNSIQLGNKLIRFKRALIATGSRPKLPDIPGINHPLVVTANRIFDLKTPPDHLTILGGGPVGCELAQAFSRLGGKVTLVQSHSRLLPREDPDSSQILARALTDEGIELLFDQTVKTITPKGAGLCLDFGPSHPQLFTDLVLAATGRQPNIETLDLEKAGVRSSSKGVSTREDLSTDNARIFASGDVTGRWHFTHASEAMSRLVLRNGLIAFPFTRKKVSQMTIPWITWTQPQVGGVGFDEQTAISKGATTIRVDSGSVDRLRLSGKPSGFFKLFVRNNGEILGARACANFIEPWLGQVSQAMEQGIKLGALADSVHPYPGSAEALKKAAGEFRKKGFTPFMKNLIGWWIATRN